MVTILSLLVLSIVLPTLDTNSDINLVTKLYRGGHYCADANHHEFDDCSKDPKAYCSRDEYQNNRNVCGFSPHHRGMATAMFTPFLLNYFFCLKNFLKKEKNKKFTFIFALLNFYPQFGTFKPSFTEIIVIIINYFQYCSGRQDHHPPV